MHNFCGFDETLEALLCSVIPDSAKRATRVAKKYSLRPTHAQTYEIQWICGHQISELIWH